jgi:restriction endonuclease S subunit
VKTKLTSIVSIQSGIYSRPLLGGDVKYLQTRHFDQDHRFDDTVKSSINSDDKLDRHLLGLGDILMAVKGHDHFAVMYTPEMGLAVASTVFMVIRPTSHNVLPEYITWFLNHPQVQSYLRLASKGSNLPSITIKDIEQIEVPVPSIDTQRIVLQLDKLRQRETVIKQKLEELHEQSLQQQLLTAINQI